MCRLAAGLLLYSKVCLVTVKETCIEVTITHSSKLCDYKIEPPYPPPRSLSTS